jgi:hypothetical protein
MRGEIIVVWPETWRAIWAPMAKHPEFGDDLVPDLYRELVPEPSRPQEPAPPEDLTPEGALVRPEDIEARAAYESVFRLYERARAQYEEDISGGHLSRRALRRALKDQIRTEKNAVDALEQAFIVVSSYDDEGYRNRYFQLVDAFLQKFSLRYDLRRPFSLHPTLPGVFACLIRQLKQAAAREADLQALMLEFEEAVRDLRADLSAGRIKTCIQKQVNLLEGMGRKCPGVTETTLGRICNQVGTWPHAKVMEAMKSIYGFTSDYPGIRHGGTPGNSIRDIEMRDLVAVTVLLTGFSPYLTDRINSETVYRGG